MRAFLGFFPIFLLLGCGASESVIKDALQIRQSLADDPLAVKVRTYEGDLVRVGDVILTENSIDRVQIHPVHDLRYDLSLTVRGIDELRWRVFSKKRSVTEAVLLVGGRVVKVFPVVRPAEEQTVVITVDSVASNQRDAERLLRTIRRTEE